MNDTAMVTVANNTTPTLVTFLLDRSHSMDICKAATIEGFNGYVSGLQQEPDADISFSFLQFDDVSFDRVCIAVPVKDVVLLTEASYVPRGGTPLIEAVILTINAVDASLSKYVITPKVVITIQTDGQENRSGAEYTWAALQALIAEKQTLGWQFNFLGAGINAYEQGAKMGVAASSTMSYDHRDRGATKHAFAASASSARAFAAGRSASTGYTMEDRRLSGDAFVPPTLHETMANQGPIVNPGVSVAQPTMRVDLTPGNPTAARMTGRRPAIKDPVVL